MILFGASLLSEPLFIALALGAVAAVLRHRRSEHGYRWAIVAGALAGAAALTRTNGLWLALPLAFAVLPHHRWSWRASLPAAVLLTSCLLVVGPWTIRNAVVLDAFVPVTTQTGAGLSGTYNETAWTDPIHPAAWRSPRNDPRFARILATQHSSEAQLDRRLRSAVLDYVAAHPWYVLETGLRNTVRLLHLDGSAYGRGAALATGLPEGWGVPSVYGWWLALIAAALGILGMLIGSIRKPPLFFWVIPALFATVVFVPDHASPAGDRSLRFGSGGRRSRLAGSPLWPGIP